MPLASEAPRTRIMVAGTPPLLDRLSHALGRHELVGVEHVEEAVRQFEREQFGMVIIGVNFDESQMFELLERLRMSRRDPTCPVVCVLRAENKLSEIAVKGLDHAVRALRANAFLDLHNYPDNETGNGRLCRIIDYLILLDGEMQQVPSP